MSSLARSSSCARVVVYNGENGETRTYIDENLNRFSHPALDLFASGSVPLSLDQKRHLKESLRMNRITQRWVTLPGIVACTAISFAGTLLPSWWMMGDKEGSQWGAPVITATVTALLADLGIIWTGWNPMLQSNQANREQNIFRRLSQIVINSSGDLLTLYTRPKLHSFAVHRSKEILENKDVLIRWMKENTTQEEIDHTLEPLIKTCTFIQELTKNSKAPDVILGMPADLSYQLGKARRYALRIKCSEQHRDSDHMWHTAEQGLNGGFQIASEADEADTAVLIESDSDSDDDAEVREHPA